MAITLTHTFSLSSHSLTHSHSITSHSHIHTHTHTAPTALTSHNPRFVLDEILSGKPRDEVLEAITAYLRQKGSEIKENRIALSKWIITKVPCAS